MPDFSENELHTAFPPIPPGGNVIAVGLDVESVARVCAAIERRGNAFLEKVFTADEIALCNARGNAGRMSFAARWAAKEAFSKALGTGIGAAFSMTDVGVANDELGAPFFELSPRAEDALCSRGASRALLSLSHTKDFAAAVVLFVV